MDPLVKPMLQYSAHSAIIGNTGAKNVDDNE